MSGGTSLQLDANVTSPPTTGKSSRCWWLRRICSPNPFYLLSVCFVLHGTSHWFHAESGAPFSPWPLFGLTAGYTLLLAATGFVVIRFGQVWDDARSILLIILLLFVQLSLIFDDTLVGDPVAGRRLLCACWAFSVVLSEALLCGLRIKLPWLFRLPYHGLIALLFFYPVALVSFETRLPTEVVLWRIFLFPTAAAIVMLTLIPAIRRGSGYTRQNGTPWLWPWYPWSLYVFLGACIGFRAYALSQSFDPVLSETFQSAMTYLSAFGVYFLIPLVFAIGILLLEIGLVENRRGAVNLALLVPLFCLCLSIPASFASRPYQAFLQLVIRDVGSPVWATLLGAFAFYGLATIRRVKSAEYLMAMTLLLLARVGSQTVDLSTLISPQWWPLLALGATELCLGLVSGRSRPIFVAVCTAIVGYDVFASSAESVPVLIRFATASTLVIGSVLVVGAVYHDRFAWILRLIGAPLLVVATLTVCALIDRATINLPLWFGPAFVATMSLTAMGYAVVTGMPLYRLSSLLCAVSGTVGLTEMAVAYLIRESGWRGATSFVTGIGCLALAAMISSWKAGWLRNVPRWFQGLLVVH